LKKVTNKIKTSKKEDDKSPQISMSDFKGLLEQNRQRLFDNGKQDEQKDGEEDDKQQVGEEDDKQQVGEEVDEQKDGEEVDEQQVGEEDDEQKVDVVEQKDDEQKDDDKQVVEPQKDSEQVVEPVRTTMSTDENDEYKIITVKVYYPKKAISNVKMDNGNSATQTLNLLTKG